MKIHLAELQDDGEFLFKVYASSRAEEIGPWGWTKEQQLQFLRMQHVAQQEAYQRQYPGLQYKIIFQYENKVGRVAISELNEELVLVDIILLPEFQHKGIGSWIVGELQQEAVQKKKLIRLNVLANSQAQQLYERFGFQVVANGEVYSSMKWLPI